MLVLILPLTIRTVFCLSLNLLEPRFTWLSKWETMAVLPPHASSIPPSILRSLSILPPSFCLPSILSSFLPVFYCPSSSLPPFFLSLALPSIFPLSSVYTSSSPPTLSLVRKSTEMAWESAVKSTVGPTEAPQWGQDCGLLFLETLLTRPLFTLTPQQGSACWWWPQSLMHCSRRVCSHLWRTNPVPWPPTQPLVHPSSKHREPALCTAQCWPPQR